MYIKTPKKKVIFMKKMLTVALLLCLVQPVQGMLIQKIKPVKRAKTFSVINKRHCSIPSDKIKVSEKCYQDWQDISKDIAKLDCYFKGVFNAMGKNYRPDVKPSTVLKFLRDEAAIDELTKLRYLSATGYMSALIKSEDYDALDSLFAEKYNETQDIKLTCDVVYDRFSVSIMKDSASKYCKDMLERDAARVTLAEQGIFCEGDTITFDGDIMSDKAEDIEKVKKAFDRLSRE